MNEQEERFVSLHKELHTLAREAADVRKALIEGYLAKYHPDIPYKLTIVEDDILKLDVVFPGLPRYRSRQFVKEVFEYLQSLLVVDEAV